ncbi:unnamed protein product [Ilex paraguariensis]|uniref:PWWP domain-containing protein n=1 Tax=Ilex paraguariensis TaxID=185542 RepID=A0ABC8RNL1_9AQUA
MIIKRNLKSAMPSLKRCRVGDSVGEDDENSGNPKKRKVKNGYYPLHLLGEVAAGIIPFNGYGLSRLLAAGGDGRLAAARWCTEDEVESTSNADEGMKESCDRVQETSRPPLVRTSRGRVQVLPSRFNDSILDNWKKEKSKPNAKGSNLDPEFTPYEEKFSFKNPKIRRQIGNTKLNHDKFGYQCRKFHPLLEQDREEFECQGLKSFDVRKYSTSRSSLTSLHEHLADNERFPNEEVEEAIDLSRINGLLEEEKEGRKNGVYGPEDFVSGDIVWAIPGKHCPAWPAIVLDPETQAPQQVLSFRVVGAVCVMFFGYSGNGTQRGQINLNDSKPSDLRSAIEEAFLAEKGFNEMLMVEINAAAGNLDYLASLPRGVLEATDSNQDQECNSQNQASCITVQASGLYHQYLGNRLISVTSGIFPGYFI